MVKKLVFKIVFACIAFFGIGSYVMYITTGQSPLSKISFSEIKAPEFDIKAGLSKAKKTAEGGKDKMYKWTDAKGTVHYSSEPPQQKVSAEQIEIDPNATNTMQALTSRSKSTNKETGPLSASPHSPGNMKKLMDEAKNVQKLLDERKANQDARLNGL